MRPTVTYTPYATSSEEKTGVVIKFAQFEEGNLLTETRNDTESGDKSDSESIMMSEEDMENIDEKENFDDNLISTETLHDIRDGIRPIQTLIKGKHVLKYVIVLSKRHSNGKER